MSNLSKGKAGLVICAIVALVCIFVFGIIGFPVISFFNTDDEDSETSEQVETITTTDSVEVTVDTDDDEDDSTSTTNSNDSVYESSAYIGMTEEEIAELEAMVAAAESANYDSTPVSYVCNSNGDTITVGVEEDTDGEGIYLIPTYTMTDFVKNVGFYIIRSSYIEYGDTIGAGSVSDFSDYTNFVIVNQTYDILYASTYTDSSYTARWTDVTRYNGEITTKDIVYMRAIDLDSHELLATFRVVIQYDSDTDTYYLADIYDSDVLSTGELTTTNKSDLVDAAVSFFTETGYISISSESGYDVIHTDEAVVECIPKTYFRMIYSADMTAIYSDNYIRDGFIYAVSVPVDGLGFVTVYYTSKSHLVYGIADSSSSELVLYGFDAIIPFTVDSIFVEDEFVPNA